MNLVIAIILLQRDLDDSGSVDISDLNKAQELGIEAIKRELVHRQFAESNHICLLPGESK